VAVNGPIKVGECVYTRSGDLSDRGIKYIIHTVGPEYEKSKSVLFNSALLYNAVYNPLLVANKLGCKSIAFPAVSSGIYGFPKQLCAQVFFCAIKDFVMSDQEHLING
jgi:O-acetyl-ADP-ribose deacetylase (regulator of RNase III)